MEALARAPRTGREGYLPPRETQAPPPAGCSPRGGPSVRRMTMAWTTRMCMVAVSPLVQRRKTWSCDSDWRGRKGMSGPRRGPRGPAQGARPPYPAVDLLALLALAHALHVAGEDGEQGGQHGVRLGAAGALGEEVGHDGGALHDEPGHVLGEHSVRGRGALLQSCLADGPIPSEGRPDATSALHNHHPPTPGSRPMTDGRAPHAEPCSRAGLSTAKRAGEAARSDRLPGEGQPRTERRARHGARRHRPSSDSNTRFSRPEGKGRLQTAGPHVYLKPAAVTRGRLAPGPDSEGRGFQPRLLLLSSPLTRSPSLDRIPLPTDLCLQPVPSLPPLTHSTKTQGLQNLCHCQLTR